MFGDKNITLNKLTCVFIKSKNHEEKILSNCFIYFDREFFKTNNLPFEVDDVIDCYPSNNRKKIILKNNKTNKRFPKGNINSILTIEHGSLKVMKYSLPVEVLYFINEIPYVNPKNSKKFNSDDDFILKNMDSIKKIVYNKFSKKIIIHLY